MATGQVMVREASIDDGYWKCSDCDNGGDGIDRSAAVICTKDSVARNRQTARPADAHTIRYDVQDEC